MSKLLKFEVLNRFSGKVQFVAEINCAAYASTSVKLGLAVEWAIKSDVNLSSADLSNAGLSNADLRCADLSNANLNGADLSNAYLGDAWLRGADLRGADLSDADLRGADLSDADLRSADLSDADLGGQWIIQGATRSDGYAFFLQKLTADSEPKVRAGCRHFTLEEAQRHWEKTRAGTALLNETRAIIRCMVDLAHSRGLMKDGVAVVKEPAE